MTGNHPERAAVFIDGSNWYHSLRAAGVGNLRRLSYSRISQKLSGNRRWIETRYYIGALKQHWDPAAYAAQRAFLSLLQREDPRITVHLGRLEHRVHENPLAAAVLAALNDPRLPMPEPARQHLASLAAAHRSVQALKEKAVDIMLARDVLEFASADRLDVAYLLSADGDFTPVVQTARRRGKKVYVASPGWSSQLQRVATRFIRLDRHWFADCYR